MTKIEVVVPGEDAVAVSELFRAAGATGFTASPACRGSATTATTRAGCCSTTRRRSRSLITVVPGDRVGPLLAGLRPLFDASSG